MSRGMQSKIARVSAGINAELDAERTSLSAYGIGLQREGYVGGYLQALMDVTASMNGHSNSSSRYKHLWDAAARRKP